MNGLISIIIPTYNRAHQIKLSAQSVLCQTYKNLELIIVDDASTDNTEAVVRSLGDDRVRYIRRTKNGGASAARNTGIHEASGELIAFHDSDDICTLNRLELSMAKLGASPKNVIAVYGVCILYNEVVPAEYSKAAYRCLPKAYKGNLEGNLEHSFVASNVANLPTMLVRKDALLQVGGFDELLRRNVDWDLCIRLSKLGNFAFVPAPFLICPQPADPRIAARKITRSGRHGATSFIRITGKLKRAGSPVSAIASHYKTTALYLIRLRRLRMARRFLRASLSGKLWSGRTWFHLLVSYWPKFCERYYKVL